MTAEALRRALGARKAPLTMRLKGQPMPPTEEEITEHRTLETLAIIREKAAEVAATRSAFDGLLRSAATTGIPLSQIAEAAGLSKARVHQIIHGR